MRKRIFVTTIGAAILLVPLGGSPAQAAPPEGDRGALIVYATAASLPGSAVDVNKGTSSDDGCYFELSGSGIGGDGTVEVVRELSFDPSTCTQVVARAVFPANNLPPDVQQMVDGDVAKGTSVERLLSRSTSADLGLGGSIEAKSAVTYKKTLKAMIKDPINLQTTATETTLTWAATSTQVTSFSSTHMTYWLSGTGWSRTASSGWSSRINTTAAYSDTTATFYNPVFCTLISPPGSLCTTTYATHSKTRVEGRSGGGWAWSYAMLKSGGCNGMLHYDYVFK